MHIFGYEFLRDELLPAKLVTISSNISALKAMAGVRREAYSEEFKKLETLAKVESVKHSNALEGIVTTDQRIQAIVGEFSSPLNHTEAEIAGYRDVLNEIHTNFAAHDFSEDEIHQFHRQMMHLADPAATGDWKTEDNVIAERMPDGRRVVRFQPIAAKDTPEAMAQLSLAYRVARDDVGINKLLLIPCVILDFLCIHPFADGNGRLSRLLTLLLLYKNGFDAGKYVSFEQKINERKIDYYQALKESSVDWHTPAPRYFPFMINFLMTLYACYESLDRRFALVNAAKVPKMARVENTVLNSLTPLSKGDICALLPDVSPTTVEAVLGGLVRSAKVIKLGAGRATKYARQFGQELK